MSSFFLSPHTHAHKTTLHCLHATHIDSAPGGPNQFLLFSTRLLPEPATAIRPINPSTQDDYDWFGRQTINLYLSHSFHSSLLFCGCKEYHEKVSTVTVSQQWSNRVIRQSAFDLGRQLIHLPICLNYFTFPTGVKEKLHTSFKHLQLTHLLTHVDFAPIILFCRMDPREILEGHQTPSSLEDPESATKKQLKHEVKKHLIKWAIMISFSRTIFIYILDYFISLPYLL